MNKPRTTVPKRLPLSTYLTIAAVGFIVSLLCTYYYLHYIQGAVSEGVSQKMFYLVLILFGIAASALIFGAMNSFGELSGEKLDTKFQFAGPVVGVILVVLGGFFLPQTSKPQTLAIRVVNEHQTPVTDGKVTLYFSHHTREQPIDDKGTVVFSDIAEDELTAKLKVDVTSDGYERLTFDTMLNSLHPFQLKLLQARTVIISGHVTTANDMPIKDVEVLVDGTRFYGKSLSNGSYSISLTDYSAGDALTLITSHENYQDKARMLKITKQTMTDIDFVLQPLDKTH